MNGPGHDQRRRQLDALNAGRPQEPVSSALPVFAKPGASARPGALTALGLVAAIALVVVGLLMVFPLAWERRAYSCSALESLMGRQVYQWTPRAGTPGPALVLTPNAELPRWFRCYVAYWRTLKVQPLTVTALQGFASSTSGAVGAAFVGGGLALVLVAVVMRRRRRRGPTPHPSPSTETDAFSILGIDPKAVTERAAPPPVDLSKPITGEAAWKAMRGHAKDAAYRRAVETLRLRYQLVGNQMLLPNTLREIMARFGIGFREAVLRAAEDDGVGGRR